MDEVVDEDRLIVVAPLSGSVCEPVANASRGAVLTAMSIPSGGVGPKSSSINPDRRRGASKASAGVASTRPDASLSPRLVRRPDPLFSAVSEPPHLPWSINEPHGSCADSRGRRACVAGGPRVAGDGAAVDDEGEQGCGW